jgi:hypothetical protein
MDLLIILPSVDMHGLTYEKLKTMRRNAASRSTSDEVMQIFSQTHT